MDTVADRLKDLRRRAGSPTQKVVAKAVGCAYRSYQNWEQSGSGGRVVVPSYKNASALARYFDTTPEYILYGVDKDAPSRVELAALDAKLDRNDAKLDRVLLALTRLIEGELPPERSAASAPRRRSRGDDRGADRPGEPQEAVF